MTRKASHELLDELKDVASRLFCELNKRESSDLQERLVSYFGIYPNSIVRRQASAERQIYFDMAYHYCTIDLDAELSDSQYSKAVELIDAGRKAYRKLASTK